MPTYAYECGGCGHRFEEFQSMSAKPLRKCPSCGKRSLQRLIGPGAGVIFKGSGFYQTDYRSESYKRAESKEAAGGDGVSKDAGTPTAGKSAEHGAKESAKGASDRPTDRPTDKPADKPAGDAKVRDTNAGNAKTGDAKSGGAKTGGAKASRKPKGH